MPVFSSPSPLSNVQLEMSACTDPKWLQSFFFFNKRKPDRAVGAAFSHQDRCESSWMTFVCVSMFPQTHTHTQAHTFKCCYQNLKLLPPPVCQYRSGPSVVETGVKAHRATQRSSSPGKTSPPHPRPLSALRTRACLRHFTACYPVLSHQEEEEVFLLLMWKKHLLFPQKQVTLSCDFWQAKASLAPSLPLPPSSPPGVVYYYSTHAPRSFPRVPQPAPLFSTSLFEWRAQKNGCPNTGGVLQKRQLINAPKSAH